jgi:hypothetical protein
MGTVQRRNLSLPTWFYRLVALTINEDRDVCPDDFDEDLSDLDLDENSICAGDKSECGNADCDADSLFSGTDDSLTERSYAGSDADYYYELKQGREERKCELREIGKWQRKAKEAQRRFEGEMEKEVREAYDYMQKPDTESDVQVLSLLAGKLFHLYSIDHVEHCYDPELYPSKYVEFHHLDDNNAQPSDATQIHGHVYFNANSGCDLAHFSPPKTWCREELRLKSFHGEYDLVFQFVSNDYLTMTVSRELVFMDQPPMASAPELFRFMGIRFDQHKERQQRNRKRKRSTSPRESWFEMNHPMGSYNMGA